MIRAFSMLHTHATIFAKLENYRKRVAFNFLYHAVCMSKRINKFEMVQKGRILRKAFTCLQVERVNRQRQHELMAKALKFFKIGIAQQRKQEQMIVNHCRSQANVKTIKMAFMLLKEGIQAEKLDNIKSRKAKQIKSQCFLALKLIAQHRTR